MSQIRLSICIPTYNFGKFIGETLSSIIPQMTEEVEVVIVDGASTDSTQEIIESFQKTYPRIHYHRLEKKGGIDRDMAKSVSVASGEYCWLFSSDDVMRKGAVEEVLKEIGAKLDVYLCGFTICGLDVQKIFWKHPISKIAEETVIDMSDEMARLDYFRKGHNSAAFFSFMGSLIINKKRWDSTAIDEQFYGGCWAHAARIFNMIPQGLKVKFLPHSFLFKRSFNDSFMEKGIIHRYAIAINGYHQIGDICFGHDREESFHMRRAIREELPLKMILNAKAHIRSAEDRKLLNEIVQKHYSDPSILHKLYLWIYRLIPTKSLLVLRLLWKARRLLWAFRLVRIKYVLRNTIEGER